MRIAVRDRGHRGAVLIRAQEFCFASLRASRLGRVLINPIWSNAAANVRFSNRPFGVKRFQTIHHHCSVDVTHGLVLLFGIGTKALPSWDSGTRWNNLFRGLTVID